MTKTWEAVREETCRLYSEGRSLEHIRRHLLRERHFEASTRAFRLKLRAWKVKRSESACLTCGSIPHDERVRCDSGIFLPSPREILEKTEGSASSTTTNPSLGQIYEDLLRAQRISSQAVEFVVRRLRDFSDGRTNILHYTTKESYRDDLNAICLSILVHMQRMSISIDIKDEHGQTALDIAIKTNKPVLVAILLEHGASAHASNVHGHKPLQYALLTGASSAIHEHLLRCGADPNMAMHESQQMLTPISFAIDKLAQESAHAPRVLDGTCSRWFEIIGSLARHGASLRPADLKSVICLFNRYWHLSQGSEDLLECTRSILRAYFTSSLDPTIPESSSENDCLAHSAFHHAQNNSLATLLIEEADLHRYGSALARYILTSSECPDCPYPTPNLNEALRMLLEEMSRSGIPIDFDPLIECLIRSRSDDKRDFVATIQELHPVHHQGHTFERRDEFVSAVASLPRSIRFDIAEILLRRDSPVERYDGMADIMRSVQTSLQSSYASLPEMIEASASGFLGFCDCSKPTKQAFIHCVIHVATKEAVQRLTAATAKERLGRLVALREWYHLPDIAIPQRLLAEALGSKIEGRRPSAPDENMLLEHWRERSESIKGWCGVGLGK